jgi:mRNA interferase YafQ
MIIKRNKSFINDFKKARLTDSQFEKFITYTNSLKSNGNLPPEARDHQLKGNFKDYREFHLGGDMLIIYLVQNNIITLIRIGTHSQLFN